MYKFSFNFANQSRSLEEVKKSMRHEIKFKKLAVRKRKKETRVEVGNNVRGKVSIKSQKSPQISQQFASEKDRKTKIRRRRINPIPNSTRRSSSCIDLSQINARHRMCNFYATRHPRKSINEIFMFKKTLFFRVCALIRGDFI